MNCGIKIAFGSLQAKRFGHWLPADFVCAHTYLRLAVFTTAVNLNSANWFMAPSSIESWSSASFPAGAKMSDFRLIYIETKLVSHRRLQAIPFVALLSIAFPVCQRSQIWRDDCQSCVVWQLHACARKHTYACSGTAPTTRSVRRDLER